MTAKELIKRLKDFDPDDKVLMPDDEFDCWAEVKHVGILVGKKAVLLSREEATDATQ